MKDHKKLTDEQIKKLNDINFTWIAQDKKRKREKIINNNNNKHQVVLNCYDKKKNKKEIIKMDKEEVFQSLKCMICLELQLNSTTIAICGHSYCACCILEYGWNQIRHEPYLDYLYCGMDFK